METKRFLPFISFLAFIGIIDTSFISPIISTYARTLGASEFQAGFIAGLYALIAIPSSAILGFLVDKIGRKKGLLIGLSVDSFVLFLYLISPNFIILAIVRSIHAIVDSFIFPSSIALVGDFLIRKLGYSLSFFWTLTSIGIIIGASLSAFLVTNFGFSMVFIFLILLLILGFFIVSLIKFPEMYKSNPGHSFKIVKTQIKKLIPAFFSMFSIYFIIGSIVGSLSLTLILLKEIEEKIAAAQIGIFMAVSVSISIPIFFIAGKISDKKGAFYPLVFGLTFAIITGIILYLNLDLTQRLLSAIFFGISLGFIYVGSTFIVASLPGEARGGGGGINQAFSLLGVALGSFISGLLLEIYSSTIQFLLATFPGIVCLILIIFLKKFL